MVFVLDVHQKTLMPCSEKRARQLLERGRAVVHKMAPFTIRLKDRTVDASTFQQPDRHLSRQKNHFGFHTGDLVQAVVPRGKYTGRFDMAINGHNVAQGISYQYCHVLQRGDGWQYTQRRVSV